MRRLAFVLLALGLAACAQYELVRPGPVAVRDGLTVSPALAWNRVANPALDGRVEVWTLDGPALNFLLFVAGASEGEALFKRRGAGAAAEDSPAVFRASMTAIEIRELFEQTVARAFEGAMLSSSNLEPVRLAGGDGYRFETSFIDREEVEHQGVVFTAIRGGKLYLAWFQGTRLYHYPRYRDEVERMLREMRA